MKDWKYDVISMKKISILRKIHAKFKPFRSTILQHREKLNMLIYYTQHLNRKSELVQMPEAAVGGILWEKVFFKI